MSADEWAARFDHDHEDGLDYLDTEDQITQIITTRTRRLNTLAATLIGAIA